ncbi:uncharacterized protein RAG0_13051 [Rhynchosporium agropyri]|uniref:Uncharacterized protein n=1 Tax=Rhynchosporium agropyri TaxID=914238 RepID=A0A1E1LAX0_9HELO|nr:uncharacterized protein RAG0_13051 [Rhynchosporium agropyri]
MQATVEDEREALDQAAQAARADIRRGKRMEREHPPKIREREDQRTKDEEFRSNEKEYFRQSTGAYHNRLITKEDEERTGREDERRRIENEYFPKPMQDPMPKIWQPVDIVPIWKLEAQAQKDLRLKHDKTTAGLVASYERQVKENEEERSTAGFTYRWFGGRGRRFWRTSSPAARTLASLFAIATFWTVLLYTYRLVVGWVNYTYSYFLVSSGYDVVVQGCYRAKNERRALWRWGQRNEEWFFLQRCLGLDAADGREEGLSTIARVYANLITDPFGASPGMYIVSLGLFVYFVLPTLSRKALLFVLFVLPPIGRLVRALFILAWYLIKSSWGKMSWILLTIYLFSLVMNKSTHTAIVIGLGFTCTIVYYCWIHISVILSVLQLMLWRLGDMYDAALGISNPHPWDARCQGAHDDACFHSYPCDCFVEKDSIISKLRDQNVALERQDQLTQNYRSSDTRRKDRANYTFGGATDEEDSDLKSLAYQRRDSTQEYLAKLWENRYTELQSSFDRLKTEKDSREASYRREVESLRHSVNYTASVSLDTDNATNELRDARATVRNLERERHELSMAGMSLRQELAKEKESHSEKCQNNSSCQRRIQELEENYDRVISHMREDQFLVTDACIKLGMDAKEAEHVQLRAYLAEVTIKLAQLYTLGVPGADTSDLQVAIMRKELAREATYKHRLERELERIGGNVLDVRMGLDTTRPQDWKIEIMTFEQNHLRVYPIYIRLWQAIIDMTEVYAREGYVLPDWFPQATKDDMNTAFSDLPPNEADMQLVKWSEIANPHVQSFDALIEKLVISEFQRLYNRGLQLLSSLDGNMTVHATIPGIQHVIQILNEVLHEVLDSPPAILPSHPTERALSPRKAEKYKIYSAMQTSITSLNNILLSNKRVPPPWLSTAGLDDRFNKPYDSPENLAANLSNHEIVILAKRISQLVAHTEEYGLLGTKAGPPYMQHQHDPTYISRWQGMLIARTYAELAVSHWNIHKAQKEVIITDSAGRQLITLEPNNRHLHPLDLEMFKLTLDLEQRKKDDEKWVAKMINDPHSGPALMLAPARSIKKQPPTGPSNNTNTNTNSNNNTVKEDARARLVNEWNEAQERCQQLYNHVIGYGIKGNMPRFKHEPLRSNADPERVRREIDAFKEQQNQYVGAMTGGHRNFIVPKTIRKGGNMNP